jgi:hypothetical protein
MRVVETDEEVAAAGRVRDGNRAGENPPTPERRAGLHLVALTVGELTSPDLWTLRRLAGSRHRLSVVRAERPYGSPPSSRLRTLLRRHGAWHVLQRLLGTRLVGVRFERTARRLHDKLFDLWDLQAWWKEARLPCHAVPYLNSRRTRDVLGALAPDLAIRVSGGVLGPGVFGAARLGTLNVHHGLAPAIRGVWSIPWGLLEGRLDWIGATIHRVDEGIDTGPVYRRVAPQLVPGDTADTLFFRTHLLAVDALVEVVETFAGGGTPEVLGYEGESVYRTAPGLLEWLSLLARQRGRRSRLVLEESLR